MAILGAVTFTVSQLFIRVPLLQYVLPKMTWFNNMALIKPLYVLFMAVTAALFEGIGRYIIMKLFMKNQLDTVYGIGHGIGHGSIEAILITGISMVSMMFLLPSLLEVSNLIIGAIERIFAICLHIGLSVMVLKSIREKKIKWLLFSIAIHTLVDIFPGLYALYGLNIWIAEAVIGTIGIGLLIYTISEYKKGEKLT